MDSLNIREFEQSIINFLKETQLPLEVKRLVLLNILSQIEKETNKELNEQITARKAQEKEGVMNAESV